MKNINTVLFIFFVAVGCMKAQWHQQGIDTIYSFTPGTGQNKGQQPEYFPANIFGLPDTTGSETVQAAAAESVCSIGFGGEITVGFRHYRLRDQPGPDFTIFENAFINPASNKIFAEPGMVSVSSDGVNFISFPFDSATLAGCAGLTPTNGKNDPFDPAVSGGDKFDLADIGVDYIKYIRIKDVTEFVFNNPLHYFYDPILSGFDLDAVIGLYLEPFNTTSAEESIAQCINVRQEDNSIIIESNSGESGTCRIWTSGGGLVNETVVNSVTKISLDDRQPGAYFLEVVFGGRRMIKPLLIIK